jgi:hypothetical protein
MHAALQLRAHSPQPLHLSVLIIGLSNENLEMNPNTVPTGQIVLQYVRPPLHANTTMAMRLTTATIITGMLLSHTSFS